MSDAATGLPRPRLVATDLDGTLLLPDGTMSERSARVLGALPDVGIEVLVVTARPPRWLEAVAGLGHATVICLNGALVVDVRTSQTIDVHPLLEEVVVDLVTDLRRALPGAVFALERPSGMVAEADFATRIDQRGGIPRAERVESLVDGSTAKLLLRCPSVPDVELLDLVRPVLAGRAWLADSGAAGLAEIAAPGVTKAAALARWAAERGIRATEVWAFGDMPNDLEMLTWAGRGVAVANAHPALLAAADDVCAGPAGDGVARYLEPLLE